MWQNVPVEIWEYLFRTLYFWCVKATTPAQVVIALHF